MSDKIDVFDRISRNLDALIEKLESPEAKAFLKSKGVTHASQLTLEERQEFCRFLRKGYLKLMK